jgi:hypothetical protein
MGAPQQGSNGRDRRLDRGRGYRPIENHEVEVYDLDLAAYLSMVGLPLAESIRYEREFVFRFLDTADRVGALAIDYVNSESARFADAQRRLKKVVISAPARW